MTSRSFFFHRDAPTVHRQCKIDLRNAESQRHSGRRWICMVDNGWLETMEKETSCAATAATVVSFFAIDRVFCLFPSRLPQHLNGHVYLRSIKAFIPASVYISCTVPTHRRFYYVTTELCFCLTASFLRSTMINTLRFATLYTLR